MKRFFTVLAAILLALPLSSTAFADDSDPSAVPPDGSIVIQEVVTNQSEVTKQVAQRYVGGITTNSSTTRQVGSWTIQYSNSVAYGTGGGNKYVRHNSAKTEKTAGTGSYQAEAHGALIKGSSYTNPTVWDYISDPCAQSIVNNNFAQTCVSPWQLSSTGQQWLIISGHYFDIGINGSHDSSCDGCIDFVYTTP